MLYTESIGNIKLSFLLCYLLKITLYNLHFMNAIYWRWQYITTVNTTILRHFTHKASVTSVHTEANAHSADWLMSVFVNELAPPYVRSQQSQCEQQCWRILANTVTFHESYLHKKAITFLECYLLKITI